MGSVTPEDASSAGRVVDRPTQQSTAREDVKAASTSMVDRCIQSSYQLTAGVGWTGILMITTFRVAIAWNLSNGKDESARVARHTSQPSAHLIRRTIRSL